MYTCVQLIQATMTYKRSETISNSAVLYAQVRFQLSFDLAIEALKLLHETYFGFVPNFLSAE